MDNMRFFRKLIGFLAVIAILFGSDTLLQAEHIRFYGIESLAGGDNTSRVGRMSRNGSVVLGTSSSDRGDEAFLWTRESGTIGLGFLSDDHDSSSASGATNDGRIVVGTSSLGFDDEEGFIWTPTTGMTPLPDRPENAVKRRIAGISADGRVVGGEITLMTDEGGTIERAFRWTAEGGTEILETPEGLDATVFGISADGGTLVGSVSDESFNSTPARWTESDGFSLLETPPGYLDRGSAYGSNSDGTVIYGIVGIEPVRRFQGFHWTEETGIVGLGLFPDVPVPDWLFGAAYDVTDDGSTIVGSYVFLDDQGVAITRAMIWDEVSGQRDLQDLIESQYGYDFGGWTLERAQAISGDGRTIAGWAFDPEGVRRGFVLDIVPEPSTLVLFSGALAGALAVGRRKRAFSRHGLRDSPKSIRQSTRLWSRSHGATRSRWIPVLFGQTVSQGRPKNNVPNLLIHLSAVNPEPSIQRRQSSAETAAPIERFTLFSG